MHSQALSSTTTCFLCSVQVTSVALSLLRHRVSHDGHPAAWCAQASEYRPKVVVPHVIRTPGVSLMLSVKTFHSYTHVVSTPSGVAA